MGTVMTSIDGNTWTPKASWSSNQAGCETLGEAHGIPHVFSTDPLALDFSEADGLVRCECMTPSRPAAPPVTLRDHAVVRT